MLISFPPGRCYTGASTAAALTLNFGIHRQTPILRLRTAYAYNPLNDTWTRLPDMNNGRWYPTSTTLPNGDVLAISGTITSGNYNVEPQVWESATASWRNLSTAHLALPFYPY